MSNKEEAGSGGGGYAGAGSSVRKSFSLVEGWLAWVAVKELKLSYHNGYIFMVPPLLVI